MDQRINKLRTALLLSTGGLVLVIALVVGVAFIYQDYPGPSQTSPNPIISTTGEVQRVSLADAKAAYDIGNAVFLDVRGIEQYQESHIPGALSIPLSDITDRMDELDPGSWIITYCT